MAIPRGRHTGRHGQVLSLASDASAAYAIDGSPRVAFAVGTNSPIWPVEEDREDLVFALGE